jgi:hypothetical protein
MANRETIEQLMNRSFLSRVPEIMTRGGFTVQQAVEQAYREDESLCLELCDGGRTERGRLALTAMSAHVYGRLRSEN